MELRTFEQVVEYMEHFTNLEKKTDRYSTRTYRLDRMRAIMEKLGNPQESFSAVHVAGSKGKGSTASFIAKGLEAAGFKTGLYMSPHVYDTRERFSLCGRFFDDSLLVRAGNMLRDGLADFRFCDALGENEPTTFELYTAYAFLLFRESGCQWAVLETGLGGRLDATNIIMPRASVITPIELEHTDILGDTIEKIATEKSKIIKRGIPSFSALQSPSALAVLRAEAAAQSSAFTYLGDEAVSLSEHEIVLRDGYSWEPSLSMAGLVQAQNCALALLVLRSLGMYREGVTEAALNANALPGRMEKVTWKRPLFLDGAHTQNSMGHLLETFRSMYPGRSGVCIFGAVSGKNIDAMSSEVLECFDKIVVSRPGTFKKSDVSAIYQTLVSKKSPSQTVVLLPEAADALSWVVSNSEPGEPVLCAGSFYLAGALREAIDCMSVGGGAGGASAGGPEVSPWH
ncbi:MAG: bifunctional folylpolyglutamate synthase/dihydrofolate synthase [Spirochaetales bacterium]|nr:bifunctional folylpolyglutamate synthase/dihydrofolate synthase [Spirochaetales bacterium]